MTDYSTCPYCGAPLKPSENCKCTEALRAECKRLIMKLTDEEAKIVLEGIELHTQHPELGIEECLDAALKRIR